MRWYLRRDERGPAPAPRAADDRRVLGVLTLVWLVLLVAAAVAHGRLVDAGRGWWTWTALVGAALGFLALARENGRRRR